MSLQLDYGDARELDDQRLVFGTLPSYQGAEQRIFLMKMF
jgi:hypothetical protein